MRYCRMLYLQEMEEVYRLTEISVVLQDELEETCQKLERIVKQMKE